MLGSDCSLEGTPNTFPQFLSAPYVRTGPSHPHPARPDPLSVRLHPLPLMVGGPPDGGRVWRIAPAARLERRPTHARPIPQAQ
jgi:hypothetical protein